MTQPKEGQILTTITIRFKRSKSRSFIAESSIIKEICERTDLLSHQFQSDFSEIFSLAGYIESYVRSSNVINNCLLNPDPTCFSELLKQLGFEGRTLELDKRITGVNASNLVKRNLQKIVTKEMLKRRLKEIKKANTRFLTKIQDITSKYDIDLDLIRNEYLFSCKQCGNIMFKEIAYSSCPYCNNKVNVETCAKDAISIVDEGLKTFWQNHIWLEEGVSKLFRHLNLQTNVGINVTGISGVEHETDIVAYNRNGLVLAECTVADINMQEVFAVKCKKDDIAARLGFLFSVGDCKDKSIVKYCSSNGILFFERTIDNVKHIEQTLGRILKAHRII